MELRIASLLDDQNLFDRASTILNEQPTHNQLPPLNQLLPPTLPAIVVPYVLENEPIFDIPPRVAREGEEPVVKNNYVALADLLSAPNDEGYPTNANPLSSRTLETPPQNGVTNAGSTKRVSGSGSKSSVPLAEVLNDETERAWFDGSLNSLLLQSSPRKKRKINATEILPPLPKPQPKVVKQPKKGRLPPLLQGLHQPPPDAGLFPPITVDGIPKEIREQPVVSDQSVPKLPPPPPPIADVAVDAGKTAMPVDGEKENDQKEDAVSKSGKARQRGKPRRRWTEQETKDLLHGVAKFGIGSWKKILACEEYNFNGRSAVDLKDRFRTCCPDAYKNEKGNNTGESSIREKRSIDKTVSTPQEAQPISSLSVSSLIETHEPPPVSQVPVESNSLQASLPVRKGRKHRKEPEDLARIGIQAPFFKRERRSRNAFTEEDDDALLRGWEKYGSVWLEIKNDPKLGLGKRHPTDLRDRFRNRWPEKYEGAGKKLGGVRGSKVNSKEQDAECAKTGAEFAVENPDSTQDQEPRTSSNTVQKSAELEAQDPKPSSTTAMKLLTSAFPDRFFDDLEEVSTGDEDEDEAPITLNRNIMHWAEQNLPHTSLPQFNSTNNANYTYNGISDPPTSLSLMSSSALVASLDGVHINPFLSLDNAGNKIPSLSMSGNGNQFVSLPVLTFPPPNPGVLERNAGFAAGNTLPPIEAGMRLPRPGELLMGLYGKDGG